MGRKCSVKGCLSDSQRREDLGVTFHRVPLHSDIRPKWFILCQIPEEKKVAYVCSRHFLRADFCNFKGKKYMLRQGALPSIFPWNKPKPKPIPLLITKLLSEENESTNTEHTEDTSESTPEENKETDLEKEEAEDMKPNASTAVETPKESNIMQTVEDTVEIKQEILNTNSAIEQKITVKTSTGSLTFAPNARIEALDFNQTWSPATIIEVDYVENEVLVHFDSYSNKYDEWIGINSSSIRALNDEPQTKAQVFNVGERCMACWNDGKKFSATITKKFDDNTYDVLFDDGYSRVLKGHKISKCLSQPLHQSPLFEPAKGTKEERRNRNRKINVANLFKKRSRTSSQESNEESLGAMDTRDHDKNDMWIPSWSDGKPVGIESQLSMLDGFRPSVIVPDPKLPPKWEKHLVQRMYGMSAGKWTSIILSPDGKRLRFKADVLKYLEENPHLNLKETMFDFVISKKGKKRKLTDSSASANSHSATSTTTMPTIASSQTTPSTAQTLASPKSPRSEEAPDKNKKPSVQILYENGAYLCPIEGCGKNFRRENLALMHVKHYHPKYSKFLDSTPNVADLAYARTVGESLDRSPISEKSYKVSKPRISTPKIKQELLTDESIKDTEIIKLLTSKSFETAESVETSSNDSQMPPINGTPTTNYQEIKLKDLLVKSEDIDCNKPAGAISGKTAGIKTLLPVKKEDPRKETPRRKRISESVDSPVIMKEIKLEEPAEIPPPQQPPPPDNNIIIEGGEVIKIVRMKQEEIINCTCGITEEDGLMIQCELCLCWQHAYCNNIQKENEVPDKYICYICQHPVRQRASKKYMHDQDWLKHGTLPSASYHCKDEESQKAMFERLKTSHDLSGGLLELKDFMHSLKLKIKIAEMKNHPKLYLWSKPWDKLPLPEKELAKVKDEKPAMESESSMLMSLLKSPNKDDLKTDFPKIDLNSLIENNLDALQGIPQPEAAIESADCKINLLEHIAHCQNLIEERLNSFEKQINDLDPSSINDNDTDYTRIRHTTNMLLKDLNTLKELSQITTF